MTLSQTQIFLATMAEVVYNISEKDKQLLSVLDFNEMTTDSISYLTALDLFYLYQKLT